jgi:Superinfection immunity protein
MHTFSMAIFRIVCLCGCFFLYMLPTTIASRRKIDYREALYATNVLLGLTIVGWVLCLAWALTSPKQSHIESGHLRD